MARTRVRGNFKRGFDIATCAAGLAVLMGIHGCAASAPRRADPGLTPTTRFPAMPLATGPVAIRVVYPPQNAVISVAGDSTFIFGSVGNGNAKLNINGHDVPVHPNGSFLAFLPVPRETNRYDLQVSLSGGVNTEHLTHDVRITPRPLPLMNGGPLTALQQSVRPAPEGRWSSGEQLAVSVRANANASVMLELGDARRLPLVAARETLGDSTLWQRLIAVEDLRDSARLAVTRGADTLRLTVPRQFVLDSLGAAQRVARLVATSAVPDTDQVVIGRPVPNGTYKWLLLPGTVAQATARVGTQVRVRLDSNLDVWVDSAMVVEVPGGVVPRRIVGNPRVVTRSDSGWADVFLPMAAPAPYLVEQLPNALVLTVYGTTLDIDIAALRGDTAVVRNITWSQRTEDRGQITIDLASEPFGYMVRWVPGAMVLRVRRPPLVSARRPLEGLTIAVDPGHPPVGATGPTGLYEGDAVLPIAERLRDELVRRGARVILTRTTRDPVALADRPVIARRANAHAFVSIHLNALPDGVNPFTAHGTGTYFFQPQSLPLAREVQVRMVREMGLRDHGVFYDNLAVVRQTWMPSVLCEGAFIMIPEQEAWLRTPEFQAAYARSVAQGLEAYFRRFAPR